MSPPGLQRAGQSDGEADAEHRERRHAAERGLNYNPAQFGVLAGERLAGVPGMFFSIPAIAILKVVYGHLSGVRERKTVAPVRA
jgi:hypothetical protein